LPDLPVVCFVALARHARRAAIVLSDGRVEIWDVDASEATTTFDTVHEFGGRRLVLGDDGRICIAAAWRGGRSGGVVAYDAATGSTLWSRTELAETQCLAIGRDGASLWCMLDDAPCLRLDLATGATIEKVPAARRIVESGDPATRLYVTREATRLDKNGSLRSLPHRKLFLDAAFGPDALCLTSGESEVRCFELSGAERWTISAGPASNYIRLWYDPKSAAFIGVRKDFEDRWYRKLVRLDIRSGEPDHILTFRALDEDASPFTDLLVSTDREAFRLSDGRKLSTLLEKRR